MQAVQGYFAVVHSEKLLHTVDMQPKAAKPFTHTRHLLPGQIRLMFSGADSFARCRA